MDALFNQLQTHYLLPDKYQLADKPFEMPVLPQAQCIVLPLIRQVIAPILIRNNDSDMVTDIQAANEVRIRIIASKTKGVERRRGSQILRFLNLGGRAATNKAYIPETAKVSEVLDLNDFVFGISADGKKGGKTTIYPVHAAVLYSDALSIQASDEQINQVFRHGGISEEATAFDIEKQAISVNIFTTRTVLPGTLFVQTLVMTGHRITQAALNHLLLSIGMAGSYGGATATSGTNLKTHFCGAYWGNFERSINAPEQILMELKSAIDTDVVDKVEQLFASQYPHQLSRTQLSEHVDDLIQRFETGEPKLVSDYQSASVKVKDLFDAWFIHQSPSKDKKKK